MKNIILKIAYVIILPLIAVSCTKDYNHPNKNGLPSAENIDVTINVVEGNSKEVDFKFNTLGCCPMWIFTDGEGNQEITTKFSFTREYKKAGTYSVEVKAYNGNGLSEGSKIVSFTKDQDYVAPYDPAADIKILSEGSSKTWVIASNIAGHISCGSSGGDGTDWWSAAANEKAGTSLYDNKLTFNSDGTYTFDPVDGNIYVNKDYPTTGTSTEDYIFPYEKQTVTYTLAEDDDVKTITFPANTTVGYIPNPEAMTSPVYKIATLTTSRLDLIIDNGNIAWHYTFVPEDPSAGLTDIQKLAGTDASGKKWIIARNTAAHLACGESGSDGTGWWSAKAGEKAGNGVYDDVLTFQPDGTYTFDPGTGGTVYVNKDSGVGTEYNPDDGNDYQVPVEKQTSTFTLTTEGSDEYLAFPANTLVSYVPNPESYATPKYKLVSISNDFMTLLIDNGNIAWSITFMRADYTGDEITSGFNTKIAGIYTWDPTVAGHIGCGSPGGNGTDWWSAAPNEKAGVGLYDDILSFDADGTYTFDPGTGGTVYVNKDSGVGTEHNPDDGNDYQVPVEKQTSTYTITEEDGNYYINFPEGTYVSYVPNAATFAAPKYKIVSMYENYLDLITDNGDIAWHYHFYRTEKAN
ncbi:MAG: hypothetical protein LKI53_08535 [Bacteroidales bacterium]|jgi:hypothetical protein|nr:hypothetical protein [Bacteroidales bacterium]